MRKGKQTYKLPEGWIETCIDELAVVQTENTPSKSRSNYYGGNVPFYKPSDLNIWIVYKSDEYLSEDGKTVARLLPENSVLVTSIGKSQRQGFRPEFSE